MADAASPFPETHWSLVGRAAGRDGIAAQPGALERLLRHYVEPMRNYLLRQLRVDSHTADDLVQGFVTSRILEKDLLGKANPDLGRFRSLLITSLKRYAIETRRAENTQRRAPESLVALDAAAQMADPAASPDDALNLAWARQILREAADAMQKYCVDTKQPQVWGLFEGRVLQPAFEGLEPAPYGELVSKLQLSSPGQASSVLVTGNRMFGRMLRQVIGQYEKDEADIDAEINDLKRILSEARAR